MCAWANTPRASRGSLRQYCGGTLTVARNAAAACHGQRGFHSRARASATRSARPVFRLLAQRGQGRAFLAILAHGIGVTDFMHVTGQVSFQILA